MREVVNVKPRNRVRTLFRNPEWTRDESGDLSHAGIEDATEKYRLVINCRSEKKDNKLSSKITIGY